MDRKPPTPIPGPGGRPARVLAYVRVSGPEQRRSGTSIDGQREAISRYCEAHGLPAPRAWVEVQSGGAEKIERRVELRALLDEARPGDLILVTLLDRWSRDIVFGVDSIRKLVARGIGWRSITENIDASTRQGDQELGLRAWLADNERQRIKDRTVGRRLELKDKGLYVDGLTPYGMRRGPKDQRLHLTLVEQSDEAALVLEAFQRCAAGASVEAIREWLEVEGGRKWDKKAVHALLKNRVYLGEVKSSSGEWIPGRVPQIVTRELFDRAQAALASRRLTRSAGDPGESRTAGWLLRGLATCPECGSRMGAQWGRMPPPWGYYACARRSRGEACAAPWVKVQVADERTSALALQRLRELRGELAASVAPEPAKPRDFAGERERLSRRRERAIALATDGTITSADLRTQLAKLAEELGRIDDAEREATRTAAGRAPEGRAEALADVSQLERAWTRASVATRREALRILARRIVLRPEGPEIEWASAEELAAERVKTS